jgi:hypothetical protein
MIVIAILGFLLNGRVNATEPGETQSPIQPTLTATVSKSDVHVAEPFVLELTVVAPLGAKVTLPAIGEQISEFEILDYQDVNDIPSDASSGERIWTRRMTLESIVTGELEIPALEIRVSQGAHSETLRSQVIPVHVISVLEGRADPTQFRDIQSVVDVDIPQPKSIAWVWWTAGGLGLLTLFTTAFAVVTRRQTWLTPVDWAKQELERLQASEAMQNCDSETVTQELLAVIRDFLELQFEISAPVQTSSELLQVVESGKLLNPELVKRFGKLFAVADQTKFAGLTLTPSQIGKLFNEAQMLIDDVAMENVADSAKISESNSELSASPVANKMETN